jgi:hypothetical protein
LVVSNTSPGSNTSADAVGMTMPVVPAWAAAERLLDAADRKPPFPGELTVGFPGELKAPTAALMVPATAVAIGVLIGTVPVWAAAEHVLDTADRKPPIPGELTVGFPVESKAPTAALMVPATAVAIGVLLAVASGMKKGVETRRLDSLMGWEQLELKEPSPSVSFCQFLLLEHWVAVLCLDQVMKVHVLHF